MVVGPLQKPERRWFFEKSKELFELKCMLLLMSYCCDSPEAKDFSAVRPSVLVGRSCVKCMVIGEDIISNKKPVKGLQGR